MFRRPLLLSRPLSKTLSSNGFRRVGLRQPTRNFHWSRPRFNSANNTGSSNSRPSLKELTKKYGWTAFGVYMTLSAIDLPLCFLFVHSLGKERVEELEHKVKGWFGMKTDEKTDTHEEVESEDKNNSEQADNSNWGLLLTEFGIAYAIHKSVFIFVRVPATAAITPWAVKTLKRWGFNIGSKKTPPKNQFGTPPTNRQKWTSWFF